MNLALARLVLRRALPWSGWGLWVLLAVLAVRSAWQPQSSVLAALGPSGDAAALARAGTWTALLSVGAIWLAACAAGTLPGWRRRGEIEWLVRGATRPVAVAASAWIGLALAAALLVLATGAAAELAAGSLQTRPPRELSARFASLEVLLGPTAAPARVVFDPGALVQGSSVRWRQHFLGGGPSALLRVVCGALDDPKGAREAARIVSSSLPIEIEASGAAGARELRVAHVDGEALLELARDGIEVLVPAPSELTAGLRFAWRAWLVLAALLALALALGAWMGAGVAFASSAALCLAALLASGGWARWLPGAGLDEAHALLGEGIAAGWAGARVLAGSAAAVAASLALASRGLAHWRNAAR